MNNTNITSDLQFLKGEERPSDLIPREFLANMQFRSSLIKWAMGSEQNQQTIISACTRDFMFFVDTFVWASDVKRHPENPDRPFIAWDFQREVLEDMRDAIGKRSVGIVKSRDIGGSTMPLIVFKHILLFSHNHTLMILSRNERLVDDASNPDSLFAKMDYMMRWLPSWMTANISRKKLTYENLRNHNTINGSSSNADAGRGGRNQGVFIDEHAAWDRRESIDLIGSLQHNTKCRIWVSTPKGVNNGFHQIITSGATNVHKLHWSKHPIHGSGLYTSDQGKRILLDKEYWKHTTPNEILKHYPELKKKFPEGEGLAADTYPFILDGKVRSPYYDYESYMCPIPKLIAQELDMDFIGSGSPFFDNDELRTYTAQFSQKPFHCGEFTYELNDDESVKWAKSDTGRFQLWMNLDAQGKPANDRAYVIGVDISAGTGASNSHISVGDCLQRSKVAGFTTPHMRPERFAEYVYAVGKFFHFPMICFEGGGVGSDFGARLKELHYPSLYYMTKTSGKKAEKPGVFPTKDSKRNLLTEYGRALTMREFTNPDEVAVNECQCYEFCENGLIAHVESVKSADPSGAKGNHGDRVIGDALNWMLMKGWKRPESPEIVSRNSFAYLQKQLGRDDSNRSRWTPRDQPRRWSLVR